MQDLVSKINSLCDAFKVDAEKAINGNKTAGQRARKTSNELTKLFKEFRKVSLAN